MTELKTLKDLTMKPLIEYGVPILDVNSNMLKAEAIKWVKHWNKLISYCKKKTDNHDEIEIPIYAGKIEAFKQFFNITEEDLK